MHPRCASVRIGDVSIGLYLFMYIIMVYDIRRVEQSHYFRSLCMNDTS